jgi:hypothetical protein
VNYGFTYFFILSLFAQMLFYYLTVILGITSSKRAYKQGSCVYSVQISFWHRKSGQMSLYVALTLSSCGLLGCASHSCEQQDGSPFSSKEGGCCLLCTGGSTRFSLLLDSNNRALPVLH